MPQFSMQQGEVAGLNRAIEEYAKCSNGGLIFTYMQLPGCQHEIASTGDF